MAQQQISEDAQRFFDSFMKELDLYMQYRDTLHTDEVEKIRLAKEILSDDTITERDDELDDRIREMYDGLDRVHYKSYDDNKYNYLEIALALGGPNVWLILNDRWNSAKIEYHRGSEHATYNDFTKDEVETLMSLHNPDY